MSDLKVLQSFPTERRALLKAISGIDPTDTNLIIFDLEDHIPRLPPHNTLKYFNGTSFKPYDVLHSLSITLEYKVINIEVEVFDAPLDYNLLLGRSWIDSMHVVVLLSLQETLWGCRPKMLGNSRIW
jgi:hypothetical protein